MTTCDWCRRTGTHTAAEHPLPREHPDYDAFYDAADDELAELLAGGSESNEGDQTA